MGEIMVIEVHWMGWCRALLATGFLWVSGSACDPFVFEDLKDEAPTRVNEAPDGYSRAGFGQVVTGYHGSLGDREVSRFAVSAGPDSGYVVFAGWNGDRARFDSELFGACNTVGSCGIGKSISMVGVPTWGAGELCLLVPAPGSGQLLVDCESPDFQRLALSGADVSDNFGFSAAAVRNLNGTPNDVAVAVFGAPDREGRAGGLYVVEELENPLLVELPEGAVGPGNRTGASVSAVSTTTDEVWVAAGAPGLRRVLLFVLTREESTVSATLRACIDNVSPGFGGTVHLEDVNADGLVEVFVSASREANAREDFVFAYGGIDLPANAGCEGWGGEPLVISCVAEGDDSCAGSGFGGALASGDLNADGFADLVIGAPAARAGGQDRAGAVFVVPGSATGLDSAGVQVLELSSPERGDELGTSVATVLSRLSPGLTRRHEIVAGAPGLEAGAAFLCSGLGGDTPLVGAKCQP